MLKRPAILCASLLFAAIFALGLVRLFELRFDRGDLYPPYSTLRTDPLGASVFYESLQEVPGVTAQRYFEETFKSDDGRAHTLFLLGTQPYREEWLSRTEFDTLQRFVFNGGRIVIAYYPERNDLTSFSDTNETDSPFSGAKKPRHSHPKDSDTDADDNGAETNLLSGTNSIPSTNTFQFSFHSTNNLGSTNSIFTGGSLRHARRHKSKDQSNQQDQDDEDDSQAEMRNYTDLSEAWGFHLTYNNLETNDDGEATFPNAKLVSSKQEIPALLPVHTSLCFTNLTNGWITIYQRNKKMPVMIERKFGAGSVLLVADSYPFSNEAMFKDRSAPLLAWLLGSGRDTIFDEAHLGILERPGMATLMRRYQLHGLIASLLLVAGLFVWKNSLSLVPPAAATETEAGPVVAGRASASGFVNLLRRGIVPAEIINVCFAEWTKSRARIAAISPSQRRDVEQLVRQQAALEPQKRRPVENYRVISQILQRRKQETKAEHL